MTFHQPRLSEPQRALLTVDDFLALAERGAFAGYAKSELIEGEIWVVNAVHRRHARIHAALVGELYAALRAARSPLVLYANPSTELSAVSLPEPDIAIALPDDGKVVAGPSVRLAIEISDTSLGIDLGRKARLYAAHDVPEYWVVDVDGGVVHQHWQPNADGYAKRRDHAFAAGLSAATIDGLRVEALPA